jgi:hypothetical protein
LKGDYTLTLTVSNPELLLHLQEKLPFLNDQK